MIMQIYAIRDKKVCYMQPFLQHNEGQAKRSFVILCEDKNTSVGAYPTDHELYFIGTYNDQTGVITPITPEFVMSGGKKDEI